MNGDSIVFSMFLIFAGAALTATLALYARQALLVAYILVGVVLGPSVLGVVSDAELIKEIAHVGIIFLLFLLGLDLNPRELLHLARKSTLVTAASSLAFAVMGAAVGWAYGLTWIECLLVGAAATFSSTIIGLKLLPTTVLHHQRTGEIIISILLFQDLIAILLLLVLKGGGEAQGPLVEIAKLALALPLLIGLSVLAARYVLFRLIQTFDAIKEYIFLMAIGWCLAVAEAAAALGLSYEIGAFIAGISLATNPVSLYIAENLRPLRDFFLVMFFFALGAGFDIAMLGGVLVPALALAALSLYAKPPVFRFLLEKGGEGKGRAGEVGVRLGQLSEFSLLIAVLAFDRGQIGAEASYLIQLATLLSFLGSTYRVVLRYPTPIALSERLRRD